MNTKNNTINYLIGIMFVFALGIFLFGCSTPTTIYPVINQTNHTPQGNITLNNSPITPIDYTAINATTFGNVVDANNQFALDLYARYNSQDKNIFYSPYSIESALAMTYEGAKGRTGEEMHAVLHLPNDTSVIRSDFAVINNEINTANKPYSLSVANALWAQNDYPFIAEYLSNVDKYYSGKVTNLDFKTQPEPSRITINNWVAGKTNDRIKDLLPPGILTTATRLVLTNAIYFKANWTNQFLGTNTHNQQFTSANGNIIDVPMMHQTSNFNYAENSDMQMLEMNYLGDDLSMLIILPKDNNMRAVEKDLAADKVDAWKKSMMPQSVAVTLPKFKFETTYFMSKDLVAMGMPTAFNADNADFTGMYNKGQAGENLYISEVIHKTFIEVAENGTEAAAATAVIMTGAGQAINPNEPKYFIADHPFIFIIQQKSTGNILFMGKMNDPSK